LLCRNCIASKHNRIEIIKHISILVFLHIFLMKFFVFKTSYNGDSPRSFQINTHNRRITFNLYSFQHFLENIVRSCLKKPKKIYE
jgi:hypothetical protein